METKPSPSESAIEKAPIAPKLDTKKEKKSNKDDKSEKKGQEIRDAVASRHVGGTMVEHAASFGRDTKSERIASAWGGKATEEVTKNKTDEPKQEAMPTNAETDEKLEAADEQLATLDHSEQQQAYTMLAEAKIQTLTAESVDEDDAEAVAEHAVAVAYAEKLLYLSPDEASAQTVADFGLTEVAKADTDNETDEPSEPGETIESGEVADDEAAESEVDAEPEVGAEAIVADKENDEAEDTQTSNGGNGQLPPTGNSGNNGGNNPNNGNNNNANVPPTPPGNQPPGPNPPMPSPGPNLNPYNVAPPIVQPITNQVSGGGNPHQNFNVAPVNPNVHVPVYEEGPGYGSVLLAGIVGYFWGRRRGRIRTEKKLLPIQKKLEKNVAALQENVDEQEQKLRVAAREQARLKNEAVVQHERIESLQNRPETVIFAKSDTRSEADKSQPTTRTEILRPQATERAVERQAVTNQESFPVQKAESVKTEQAEAVAVASRAPAVEARQLHSQTPPQENIGKLLVGAEAVREVEKRFNKESIIANPAAAKAEFSGSVETVEQKRSLEKQVESLTDAQLLNLSEKIVVEGSSLRKVYENHLITERGLRRLVTEYLRGGDVLHAFKRELIEREIDFERDPKLRDKVRHSLSSDDGGAASQPQTLDELLEAAGAVTIAEQGAGLAMIKKQQQVAVQRQRKEAQRRRMIDISLASTIAVLVAVIFILFVVRR